MYDSRLIGTWRSDGRKTRIEIASRHGMRLAKNKKLASLFGRLEVRYTRSGILYSRLDDHETANVYQVVAKNEYSVVLVTFDSLAGKQIVHIHFEGNCTAPLRTGHLGPQKVV